MEDFFALSEVCLYFGFSNLAQSVCSVRFLNDLGSVSALRLSFNIAEFIYFGFLTAAVSLCC